MSNETECACGQDMDALPPLHRFVRNNGARVCRWCLVDQGRLLADPLLPRPSNPPSGADQELFAAYERVLEDDLAAAER